MNLEKMFEYFVAGCFATVLTLIILIASVSMILPTIIDSVTETVAQSVENKINNTTISCSSKSSPGAIQITLNEETFYCLVT